MEKPIAEFKLNEIPLTLLIVTLCVPIIAFMWLFSYNIIVALSVAILVYVYEFFVIKGENNYTFAVYKDKLEGKIEGKMYKLSIEQINKIHLENNKVYFKGLDENVLLKINVKDKNKDFITTLKREFPEKIIS